MFLLIYRKIQILILVGASSAGSYQNPANLERESQAQIHTTRVQEPDEVVVGHIDIQLLIQHIIYKVLTGL